MTTNALAVRAGSALDEILAVARVLAASGYFDAARTTPEQAAAQLATKILAGAEMGYGPFASVQGIHIIQGRPAMSANLMASAVKASARYDYRVRRLDDSVAEIEFFERRGGQMETLGVSTFTAEDARRAGTQNMGKFPRNMLFARALSNGVRWYTPDVFLGAAVYTPEELDAAVYTPDELGAAVDAEGNVIDLPPQPSPGKAAQPSYAPAPAAADDVPAEVRAWERPEDAYEWAVGIGASDNVFAARNAFKRIVDAHGGRLTRENAQSIYTEFYHDRMARAQEKAEATLENLDMSDVPEIDPEG